LSTKRLTLKANSRDIHIFNGQTSMASHPRSYEKHLHFEKPEHRQGLIAIRKAAQASKLHDAFQALGNPAQEYLGGLLYVESDIPHHLQKIMDLVSLYGQTEVLQALDHAVKRHAFGLQYLQEYLQQRIYPRTIQHVTHSSLSADTAPRGSSGVHGALNTRPTIFLIGCADAKKQNAPPRQLSKDD
jgi:hypothetical protein